jgi:hypothetical protein
MTDFSDPSFYLPVILGIVAVVLAGFALWRQKKELRTSPTPQPGITPQQGILSQQELRKRDALEWKKLKDVAKALGWVWDRMNEEDD